MVEGAGEGVLLVDVEGVEIEQVDHWQVVLPRQLMQRVDRIRADEARPGGAVAPRHLDVVAPDIDRQHPAAMDLHELVEDIGAHPIPEPVVWDAQAAGFQYEDAVLLHRLQRFQHHTEGRASADQPLKEFDVEAGQEVPTAAFTLAWVWHHSNNRSASDDWDAGLQYTSDQTLFNNFLIVTRLVCLNKLQTL